MGLWQLLSSNLARGFTGHQMLDDVGLVHMNGRLYDPALGRMCGADPYVQTPENLQNYNRYSYVLNNPLSQVDPSGHFIVEAIVAIVAAVLAVIGAVIATVVAFVAYLAVLAAQFVVTVISAVGQALGAIGSALMSAAKAGVAYVAANLTMGKVLLGAALGAIYNGAQVAINGGSFSQILKAAALGAVTGAVGAVLGAFLHGFGEAIGGELAGAGLGEAGGEIAGKVVHAAAHGAVGGGMSAAQGGSFKDGFIGSAIGAGVSTATGYMAGDVMDDIGIVGRTAVASISGGTASVLAGGKFADGAYSAAFFHLFNCEGQQVLEVAGEMAHTVYQGLARFGDALNPFGDPALNAGVYDETLGGGVYSDIASVTNPIAIGGKLGLGQKISQGWNKLKAFAWTRKATKTPLWSSTKAKTGVENAFGHWQKHGAEFPEFQNAKQYVEGAKSFFSSPPTGTLSKVRPNGDKLFYNPANNTFGVQAADGAPRTMFRPTDGINYWNKQ